MAILGFADKETEKIYSGHFSRQLPTDIQRTALRKLIYMIPLPRMSEYLLDDFMIPMGLTAQDVSKGAGIPLYDVSSILADMREITPKISEKLGEYFGVSAMLFYDIQQDLKARAGVHELALA